MQYSDKFINKMNVLLGNESQAFFDALEKPISKAITVNTLRQPQNFENLIECNYRQIPKINNGYIVDNLKVGKHILSHLGVIYSQEPSAMYPVQMLDIQEGDIILDLCAAPGGKSIQILEKLKNTGLLVSNEIVYNRTKILYENLNRMGFTNFAITCNSPQDYEKTSLKFDKILVDAPCGGEGMFRRSDFDFDAYNNSSIETNAKRQLSILNSIKNLLKPNGKLVYSTCTYDIIENENVVAEFLKTNPDFQLVNCPELDSVTTPGIHIEGTNTELCKRRYPHLFEGEGQFMAVMQKVSNGVCEYDEEFQAHGYSEIYRKEIDPIKKAFKDVANISQLHIVRRGENYYSLPNTTLDFEDLNLVSIGTHLGQLTKSGFKIAHSMYHNLGELFYNKIELSKEEVEKYLIGYELDTPNTQNGVCVVTHLNIPLGGGKISNGKLKNYYPQNLRN